MKQEQILKILEGDSSDILIANWRSKKAVLLILTSIFTLVFPIQIYFWTGFPQFLLIIPGTILYGVYLGFKNEVVFYANNKDVWNIVWLGSVPLAILWIGNSFMPEGETSLIVSILALLPCAWFGIKSSNATILMNSGVSFYKLVCVSLSKVVLIFVFVFVMLMIFGRENKKPGDSLKKTAALGITAGIGSWLYIKLVNTRQVFEKRGINGQIKAK